MTFREAADTVLLFGKFKGKTLDQVAESDEGLLYLDWLVGQDWVRSDLKEALSSYLRDPGIIRDVKALRRG